MAHISNKARAQVLIDALPYIQKYNNKTIVVKYGGNAMINEELKQSVMDDITLLKYIGIDWVETREWFIKDQKWRTMNYCCNELNFLSHTF